jgi:hypothetical protein
LDDPRNTDNAWVEAKTVFVHDADGMTDCFKLNEPLSWTTVYAGIPLPAQHHKILTSIAEEMNASYSDQKPSVTIDRKSLFAQVRASVLFDYAALTPAQLDIHVGEELLILSRKDNWWLAQNTDGQQGYVPSNFVEVVDDGEDDDEAETDDTPDAEATPRRKSLVEKLGLSICDDCLVIFTDVLLQTRMLSGSVRPAKASTRTAKPLSAKCARCHAQKSRSLDVCLHVYFSFHV